MKILKYIIALLCCFLLLYGSALIGGALIPVRGDTAVSGNDHIYLIDNGTHVELCLPAENCPPELLASFKAVSPYPLNDPVFLCFGWGERTFYPGTPTVKDLDILTALRVSFIPTPGVIRLSWYYNRLKESDQVRRVIVNTEQITILYDFIIDHLIFEGDKLQPLNADMIAEEYTRSLFVEAAGTYSLFFTCNNWTNTALKKAGIPTHLWTPTPWGIGNS